MKFENRGKWIKQIHESTQKNEGLLDKLFSKKLTNNKFRKLVKDYTFKSNPRDFALNILSKLPDNTTISYKIKDKQNYFKKVDDNWWKSKNRDKLLDYEIARELVGSYIYQIPLFDVVEINYANESSQMNETRSYKVTVKLEVPDKMNNRDIEDYIENKVDNSNFGVYVLDVTAERA